MGPDEENTNTYTMYVHTMYMVYVHCTQCMWFTYIVYNVYGLQMRIIISTHNLIYLVD